MSDPKKPKKQVIKECGTQYYTRVVDPHTGEPKNYISYCGFWRECAECFQRRIDNHREAIKSTGYTGLKIALLSEERAKEFVKQTDSSMYMRYPFEPHPNISEEATEELSSRVGVLFFETEYEFPDDVNVYNYSGSFITVLVRTRWGKRISGKLYSLSGHKSSKRCKTVRVSDIRVRNEDRREAEKCLARAYARSASWNPDEETIQFGLDARVDLYREELKRAGISILEERNLRNNIDLDEVSWTNYAEEFDPDLVSNFRKMVYYYYKELDVKSEAEEIPTTSMDIGTMKFIKGIPKPT